jgi:hypothetical protein
VISLEESLERRLYVQRELEEPRSKQPSKELAMKFLLTANSVRQLEIEGGR